MLKTEILAEIEPALTRFEGWLDRNGYYSYDQFDFWASRLGVAAKKMFNRNKILAAPLVILLQALESFLPCSRVLFAPKKRFAIGDAHLALGYMNLYRCKREPQYLEKARVLLEELQSTATHTPSGIGWGYPYTWVTRKAVYPPGTPFITVTPYCFNAFQEMARITGEEKYLDTAAQIARFVAFDLNETPISPSQTAAGYGLGDHRQVINANAYRAALLLKAGQCLNIDLYKEKALKNLAFIIYRQQTDGSWLYDENEPFIDNFHTCFVLKNLYKSYLVMKENNNQCPGCVRADEVLDAVKKGYDYYRRFLFRADGTPIHFAKTQHTKFRKIEMYDYAEGIALGPLLNEDIDGALDFSLQLVSHLIDSFQLKDGHFVTRVTTLNTWNKIPYLRWPQAQLFHALTLLLVSLSRESKGE